MGFEVVPDEVLLVPKRIQMDSRAFLKPLSKIPPPSLISLSLGHITVTFSSWDFMGKAISEWDFPGECSWTPTLTFHSLPCTIPGLGILQKNPPWTKSCLLLSLEVHPSLFPGGCAMGIESDLRGFTPKCSFLVFTAQRGANPGKNHKDAPQGGELNVALRGSLIFLHFAGNFPAKPQSSQPGMRDLGIFGFIPCLALSPKRGKRRAGCSSWLRLCKPRTLQLNQGHPNSHPAQIQAGIAFLTGILRKTRTQAHCTRNKNPQTNPTMSIPAPLPTQAAAAGPSHQDKGQQTLFSFLSLHFILP